MQISKNGLWVTVFLSLAGLWRKEKSENIVVYFYVKLLIL